MKTILRAEVVADHENCGQDIRTRTFTAMTSQMCAEREQCTWRDLGVDLEWLENREGETKIQRAVHCDSPLHQGLWDCLIEIAGKTPVMKTLLTGAQIQIRRGEDA